MFERPGPLVERWARFRPGFSVMIISCARAATNSFPSSPTTGRAAHSRRNGAVQIVTAPTRAPPPNAARHSSAAASAAASRPPRRGPRPAPQPRPPAPAAGTPDTRHRSPSAATHGPPEPTVTRGGRPGRARHARPDIGARASRRRRVDIGWWKGRWRPAARAFRSREGCNPTSLAAASSRRVPRWWSVGSRPPGEGSKLRDRMSETSAVLCSGRPVVVHALWKP